MNRKELVNDVTTRGIDNIYQKSNIEKNLNNGINLRVKYGIDPTSPEIHIGRVVPILKLRDLQKLGCTPVLIIGDFTGTIGDTSDKDAERKSLSKESVKNNMREYLNQIGRIIDIRKSEIHYNSKWLTRLKLDELSDLVDIFSVHDFISRVKIKERLEKGKRVSLKETLYPIMQGYDSLIVNSELELGGSDQWFNLITGRKIQERRGKNPQDILTSELIMGTDGRKMSSSWGNTISMTDTPENFYGKVMSIRDEQIESYMINCTRIPIKEVHQKISKMKKGQVNPKDLKMETAYEITKLIHNESAAIQAQQRFVTKYQKKEIPNNIQTFSIPSNNNDIVEILLATKVASSKSEARRLIQQGGIKVDGVKIENIDYKVKKNSIIQKGKHSSFKVDIINS